MGLITNTSVPFQPEVVADILNKVKGHSTLAKLCSSTPIPFAGMETFVFTMDGEAAIVAKPKGECFAEALHAFFVAQVGYSLLARNYPQFVELKSFGLAE
jgi:hypothetical protein